MQFEDRHVVITGGSTGIGKATAARIIAAGGTVSLIARRADVLDRTCQELGPLAHGFVADAGNRDAITRALDDAAAARGPIDGLFLNAATPGLFVPLADYTDEALDELLQVDVKGPFYAIRHVAPLMAARGRGSILVTGSLASERGMVGNPGYLVAKHAVLGLARAAAMEFAGSGVRCNCINPGYIDTPMLQDVPAEVLARLASLVPQQRIGQPEEVAEVAAFLLSDASSHVTAQSWAVDGGVLGTLLQ